MELNLIARTINYYCNQLIKPDAVEKLVATIGFEFQMSGYYKFDFLIYNYIREGCYLTYYEGIDLDDKAQINLGSKAKFSTLTYPTSDKKDFLYQIEVINTLHKKFPGHIYDPKGKRVVSAREVKFLF